jgi:hypothetical protein
MLGVSASTAAAASARSAPTGSRSAAKSTTGISAPAAPSSHEAMIAVARPSLPSQLTVGNAHHLRASSVDAQPNGGADAMSALRRSSGNASPMRRTA